MVATSADPTKNTTSIGAAEETTPLLGAPESGLTRSTNGHAIIPDPNKRDTPDHASESPDGAHSSDDDQPMPYYQVLLLCYASLAEPVAYFSIFPFINQMIAANGHMNEKEVGFWSGLIESLFSLVQMVLMIFYGRLADRLGRKPILVFSLAGVSFATALFGISRTLAQMIFFRCLAGVFAGSVVTIRTMMSENTNKRTQGKAFSWYMFARNLGIFVGPIVGGGLARPADQFPGVFGHVQFFRDYPYALPTFVAGALCMSGTLLSLFFLKETLVRKEAGVSNAPPPLSTWEVLKSPGVPTVLYIYGHVGLLGLAYTAVSPVFQYTSVDEAGYGFSEPQIAALLALGGASQALWMLLAFPVLQRNLGTGTVLRMCVVVWPVFMLYFPLMNEFLRKGWDTAFWVVTIPSIVVGSGVAMGFACVQLCLNDISPSPTVLATVNALALTVTSGIRAVAPALFTSLFAIGVKWGWAHGHLIWFIIVGLCLAVIVPVWFFLPEAAEGRPEKQTKVVDGDAHEDADAIR